MADNIYHVQGYRLLYLLFKLDAVWLVSALSPSPPEYDDDLFRPSHPAPGSLFTRVNGSGQLRVVLHCLSPAWMSA